MERIKIVIEKNLDRQNVQKIISLLKEDMEMFSIECNYSGELSDNEYQKIQDELSEYFKKEDTERRKLYKCDQTYRAYLKEMLNLKTDRQAAEYFDELEKQDKDILKSFNANIYRSGKLDKADKHKDFLFNKITRIGGSSVGGVYNISYYRTGDFLDDILNKMKKMFDNIKMGGEQWYELTVYSHDGKIFHICTEQKEAECYLTKKQYELFKELNIVHKIGG